MTSFSRRQLYSVLIAALFWAVTVTGFVFIPLKTAVEEPVYKEIRIQLAPMEEKQPVPEPVKTPEPEPVIEEVVAEPVVVPAQIAEIPVSAPAEPAPAPKAAEPVPAPAPTAAKKAEPVQKTTQQEEPVSTYQPKVVMDPMAAAAAQNASSNKKELTQEEIDAKFAALENSSNPNRSSNEGGSNFNPQETPEFQGQAGKASSDSGEMASSSSGKKEDAPVSEKTTAFFDNFGKGGAVPTGSDSTNGSGKGPLEEGNGKEDGASSGDGLEWSSGTGRILKWPSKPEITFTEDEKAFITASVRDIHISFLVRADGTVLRESIYIDKIASLPAAISQTITRQISEWTFETGTSDGQAVFLYSIIKE